MNTILIKVFSSTGNFNSTETAGDARRLGISYWQPTFTDNKLVS